MLIVLKDFLNGCMCFLFGGDIGFINECNGFTGYDFFSNFMIGWCCFLFRFHGYWALFIEYN